MVASISLSQAKPVGGCPQLYTWRVEQHIGSEQQGVF